MRDRAVVEDFAARVAPGRIEHAADRAFADIARHQAIEEAQRIFACDMILAQRRDIDQDAGVAYRQVLAVVRHFVGAGDRVPRPAPPLSGLHQRRGAGMKRGLLEHAASQIWLWRCERDMRIARLEHVRNGRRRKRTNKGGVPRRYTIFEDLANYDPLSLLKGLAKKYVVVRG